MTDVEPGEETVVEEPTAMTEPEAQPAPETETVADVRRARGWVSLYLVSFVLLLAAGLCVGLAARNLLQSLAPLYASIALSVLAAIGAAAALFLPKRS